MLYTDGLVERRNATIDDGMNRLQEEVQARAEEPLGGLAGAIFRVLRDADHPDDVCVLAVRRLSPAREG
jgi:serine phosphatase RsbU (regulator of sigma subunit)